MNSVKIIHEAAMDYYDWAKLAKRKGDDSAWKEYLEKAYILEKEAALTMPEQQHNYMWRYILLRSAGWLAYQAGLYKDAYTLVKLGLMGNPPAIEKSKLKELADKLTKHLDKVKTSNDDLTHSFLSGFLASVDLIECKLAIKLQDTQQQILVLVPEEKIREVARMFLGDIVQIKIIENKGVKILEDIKRAA